MNMQHDAQLSLRKRAEALLAARPQEIARLSPDEIHALVHELSVHQIELELQNDELHYTQKQLMLARDNFARLYNQAPVGYVTLNEHGVILQANQTIADMLQCDALDLAGKVLVDYMREPDRSIFLGRYKAIYRNPQEKYFDVRMESGAKSFPARLTARWTEPLLPIGSITTPNLLMVISDISEQQRAEEGMRLANEALANETEHLRVTLRSIGDAVIATDNTGYIVLMNQVAEHLTGWHQDEAVGRPLSDVFRIVNEQTRLPCVNPVEEVLATGNPVALANHTVLITRDGQERAIADSSAPIYDRLNHIIGVVLVFRDITDELRLNQELQRMAKLDSLGVMAGGIAHDFNNLLTAISGNLGLVQQALGQRDERSMILCLQDAENAVMRARDLTKQLLTFARGGLPIRRTLSLPPLLREAVAFTLTGTHCRCRLEAPDTTWCVSADAGQLTQVVQNLLINAMQAMSEGGDITVTLENCTLPADAGGSLQPGAYVRLKVADQGIGIPPEIRERIFEPFFTTKPRGSGLGLASTHSIIRNHGGHISVDSTVGQGSVFTIYLPALLEPAESDDVVAASEITEQPWRILVMDDEGMIVRLLQAVLSSVGHQVATAANGDEAVAMWMRALQEGQRFDLAILDLTIPGGIGGKEVIRQIQQVDPAARAIATSGYATDPIMANYRDYGFCGRLAKPYRTNEVLNLIALLQLRGAADHAI